MYKAFKLDNNKDWHDNAGRSDSFKKISVLRLEVGKKRELNFKGMNTPHKQIKMEALYK